MNGRTLFLIALWGLTVLRAAAWTPVENAITRATPLQMTNIVRFVGTNGLVLGGGGLAQTNISYVAVTNAPWQWGSANLTNWSARTVFATNGLQGALGFTPLTPAETTNAAVTTMQNAITNNETRSVALRGWVTNTAGAGAGGVWITNTALATQFTVEDAMRWANTNNTGKYILLTNGTLEASSQVIVRGTAAGTITLGAAVNQNTAQIRSGTESSGIAFRGNNNNDFGIVLGGSQYVTFSDDVGGFLVAKDGSFGFASATGGSGWLTAKGAWLTCPAAGTIVVATNLAATNMIVNGGNLTLRTNAAPANTNTVVTWIPILGTNGQTYLIPGYQ